jgi:exodeoxyribonuclease-3
MDHLLLSPTLATRLIAADVDRQVRSWEKTSDHAPTWVELKNDKLPVKKERPNQSKKRSRR